MEKGRRYYGLKERMGNKGGGKAMRNGGEAANPIGRNLGKNKNEL
jgi:hypothetical protein